MYDWWHSGGWGMGFGGLFMLLPLALLVAVLYVFIRPFESNRGSDQRSRTPREILDERFSKGEIDREEYEMRRKALNS
ncbi:MAG: SHOCT domain-containing protein [Proteobacteria bacterium]|nr:SHOCT domain-containing protein [Pseudomonadota bacterium]